MKQAGRLLLSQPLEEPQKDGLALLFRQLVDGFAKSNALHHACLRLLGTQHGFQCHTLHRLLLQGFRRHHSQFDAGDLLYGEPRLLRQLGQLGRAAQPVFQALPRGPEHLPLFP